MSALGSIDKVEIAALRLHLAQTEMHRLPEDCSERQWTDAEHRVEQLGRRLVAELKAAGIDEDLTALLLKVLS